MFEKTSQRLDQLTEKWYGFKRRDPLGAMVIQGLAIVALGSGALAVSSNPEDTPVDHSNQLSAKMGRVHSSPEEAEGYHAYCDTDHPLGWRDTFVQTWNVNTINFVRRDTPGYPLCIGLRAFGTPNISTMRSPGWDILQRSDTLHSAP